MMDVGGRSLQDCLRAIFTQSSGRMMVRVGVLRRGGIVEADGGTGVREEEAVEGVVSGSESRNKEQLSAVGDAGNEE